VSAPRRSRRGANAIEFALILPVLLAMLTGIMDYGWLYMVRTAAVTAARVGAREGAFTPQDSDPDGAAATAANTQWASLGLPVDAPTIVAFRSGDPELMVVRIEVDVTSLVGLVAGPDTFEVVAAQPMEEQPAPPAEP
jgi:Flp pilus assembly protein TadG